MRLVLLAVVALGLLVKDARSFATSTATTRGHIRGFTRCCASSSVYGTSTVHAVGDGYCRGPMVYDTDDGSWHDAPVNGRVKTGLKSETVCAASCTKLPRCVGYAFQATTGRCFVYGRHLAAGLHPWLTSADPSSTSWMGYAQPNLAITGSSGYAGVVCMTKDAVASTTTAGPTGTVHTHAPTSHQCSSSYVKHTGDWPFVPGCSKCCTGRPQLMVSFAGFGYPPINGCMAYGEVALSAVTQEANTLCNDRPACHGWKLDKAVGAVCFCSSAACKEGASTVATAAGDQCQCKITTESPTAAPTPRPTALPSTNPTLNPTRAPTTMAPSFVPTPMPSQAPSDSPSRVPSSNPTLSPTCEAGCDACVRSGSTQDTCSSFGLNCACTTDAPTANPTDSPSAPSTAPTTTPVTAVPSPRPSGTPTISPTDIPTGTPTSSPSMSPTCQQGCAKCVQTGKSAAMCASFGLNCACMTPKPTSAHPTAAPTAVPSHTRTGVPTGVPTAAVTAAACSPVAAASFTMKRGKFCAKNWANDFAAATTKPLADCKRSCAESDDCTGITVGMYMGVEKCVFCSSVNIMSPATWTTTYLKSVSAGECVSKKRRRLFRTVRPPPPPPPTRRNSTCYGLSDDACGSHSNCIWKSEKAAVVPPCKNGGACSVKGGGASTCTCDNTCQYASDGACDDGGPGSSYNDCDVGTDCADCGPSTRTSPAKGKVCGKAAAAATCKGSHPACSQHKSSKVMCNVYSRKYGCAWGGPIVCTCVDGWAGDDCSQEAVATNTFTNTPTDTSTVAPTDTPTVTPTVPSTDTPTTTPTATPSTTPTTTPTDTPSTTPSTTPTDAPTTTPTTSAPTQPTTDATPAPTGLPTGSPTLGWTPAPTKMPTTYAPTTKAPTTKAPTIKARTTKAPTTKAPTTKAPTTKAPTTKAPTQATTGVPTRGPTRVPTTTPTTATAGCVDVGPPSYMNWLASCQEFATQGFCAKDPDTAAKHCPVTCNTGCASKTQH